MNFLLFFFEKIFKKKKNRRYFFWKKLFYPSIWWIASKSKDKFFNQKKLKDIFFQFWSKILYNCLYGREIDLTWEINLNTSLLFFQFIFKIEKVFWISLKINLSKIKITLKESISFLNNLFHKKISKQRTNTIYSNKKWKSENFIILENW